MLLGSGVAWFCHMPCSTKPLTSNCLLTRLWENNCHYKFSLLLYIKYLEEPALKKMPSLRKREKRGTDTAAGHPAARAPRPGGQPSLPCTPTPALGTRAESLQVLQGTGKTRDAKQRKRRGRAVAPLVPIPRTAHPSSPERRRASAVDLSFGVASRHGPALCPGHSLVHVRAGGLGRHGRTFTVRSMELHSPPERAREHRAGGGREQAPCSGRSGPYTGHLVASPLTTG